MTPETFEKLKARAMRYATRKGDGTTFALDQLTPGDSVVIPCTMNPDKYRVLAAGLARRTGKVFCCSVQRDLIYGAVEGLKVSRIDSGTAEELTLDAELYGEDKP